MNDSARAGSARSLGSLRIVLLVWLPITAIGLLRLGRLAHTDSGNEVDKVMEMLLYNAALALASRGVHVHALGPAESGPRPGAPQVSRTPPTQLRIEFLGGTT